MAEVRQAQRMLRVDVLDGLPGNPQRLSDGARYALMRSIARDGFVVPVLVRPKGRRFEVVSGNHRVEVARDLGLVEVPAVVRDLSDEQAARLAVELNTVHGAPDPVLLAEFVPDDLVGQVFVDEDLLAELAVLDEDWARLLVDDVEPDVDNEVEVEAVPVVLSARVGHVLVTVPEDKLAETRAAIEGLGLGFAQVKVSTSSG